jgi:hypothetical protein
MPLIGGIYAINKNQWKYDISFVTINLFTWGYNVLRHLWEGNSTKLSQKRKCENRILQNCLKREGFENTIQ